jgi:hypothetical protein
VGGGQHNRDLPPHGIIDNGGFRTQPAGAILTVDLLLKSNLLFVVIGANQFHLVASREHDEDDDARDEEREERHDG